MRAPNLYDDNGRPLALGRELGRGGEGSVFDILGSPNLAAKVYNKPRPAEHKTTAVAARSAPAAGAIRPAAPQQPQQPQHAQVAEAQKPAPAPAPAPAAKPAPAGGLIAGAAPVVSSNSFDNRWGAWR